MSTLLIVLTGIDGAGKTRRPRSRGSRPPAGGSPRSHHAGRNMSQWSSAPNSLNPALRTHERHPDGQRPGVHARARNFSGLVVMDRHRTGAASVRGLPPAGFRGYCALPEPDLVIHFDVAPEQALERILRGTDTETLEERRLRGLRALPEFPGFSASTPRSRTRCWLRSRSDRRRRHRPFPKLPLQGRTGSARDNRRDSGDDGGRARLQPGPESRGRPGQRYCPPQGTRTGLDRPLCTGSPARPTCASHSTHDNQRTDAEQDADGQEQNADERR
ncbi:hypothetical protein LJR013_000585 [Pseudarthrobacter oxydans]|uniref:hypothetical protein n=1 Tax=Pseudarthrobacter oxydans TaxID=1671 RepID=UPI003ECC4245